MYISTLYIGLSAQTCSFVPLPAVKPVCSSLSFSSTAGAIFSLWFDPLLILMLQLHVQCSAIPHQFPQFVMSHFFASVMVRYLFQSSWVGRMWLNRHSSCITNAYKLDAYAEAGSILICASMCLGCLVPAD